MLHDLRFACRLVSRERSLSAAVVLVLALGIGVNAIGFSIINAAFFRALPFDTGERLYVVTWRLADGEVDASYPEYQEWRARTRSFAGLAAFRDARMNIADDRAVPEETRGARVTANTFTLLAERPLVGRDFVAADVGAGAEPVVILSATVWRNRFGSDEAAVGRTLRVNGHPSTIVGVMRDGMKFPNNADVWVPFIPTDVEAQPDQRILTVFGRLKDGVEPRAAQVEFDVIAAEHASAYRGPNPAIAGLRISLQTFTEAFVGGPAARMLIAIMVAAGLVLLIACANVANLLLSRATARAREMAVRMSIGATRWRVVRQMLTESVVLALAGGGIGLLIAAPGVRMFESAMADSGKPYWIAFTLDYRVFVYVAAVCVLTAICAGLVPALLTSTSTSGVLREGERGSMGGRRVRRLSGTLVVAELALTFVLLAGGGLVARSFMKLYSVDLGFRTDGLTVIDMRLPETRYGSGDARRTFVDLLQPGLAAIAGVDAVALTTGAPPLDGGERLVEIDRPSGASGAPPRFVSTVSVTSSFFDVIRVPTIAGRGFTDADGAPGAETVIINERLATQFFAHESPLGRRLRFTSRNPVPGAATDVWRTVVGVIATIRQGSPTDAYLNAVVYLPFRQEAPAAFSAIVRSRLEPGAIMAAVGRAVQALDRDQPVLGVQTLDQILAQQRRFHRVFGGVFAFLAMVALVLATIGLYAVMAYAVTQRTREIGVRVAVGAQPRQVSWLILRLGLVRLATGLTIGVTGAAVVSRAVQVLLVDMTGTDPLTFGLITVLLSAVCLAACLVPARRAMQLDPVVALRAD